MNGVGKILSQTAKGLGSVVKQTVNESIDQTAQATADVASEVLTGGGPSGSNQMGGSNDLAQLAKREELKTQEEISLLREQIKEISDKKGETSVSQKGRNVEVEISQIRKEKEEKEKNTEEEELLAKIAKQREEEEAATNTDLALQGTGNKPKRGSAFVKGKAKGSGEKARLKH